MYIATIQVLHSALAKGLHYKAYHVSERRLAPLGVNAIRNRQVWHQIARQEIARPRLPDLRLQILHDDRQMLILDTSHELLDAGRELQNKAIDVFSGDGLTRVETRAVFNPLP